jgi:hypothetical protein
VGGEALEICFRFAGRNGFADLETPLPHARLNLHKGKFDAPAVHLQLPPRVA